jgi:hypothetical protein
MVGNHLPDGSVEQDMRHRHLTPAIAVVILLVGSCSEASDDHSQPDAGIDATDQATVVSADPDIPSPAVASPDALIGRWQVEEVVASWPIEWQGSPGVISFGTDGLVQVSGGCIYQTRPYTATSEIIDVGAVLASRTVQCEPGSAGSVLNDVLSADPQWRTDPSGSLVLQAGVGPGGLISGEVLLRSID